MKPLFFERGVDDLPRDWIRMVKRSIRTICPVFNAHRMVSEYTETCYVPSAQASSALRVGNYAVLREMVAWKKKIRDDWSRIAVREVQVTNESDAVKGKEVEITVSVDTAGHNPNELRVELLHGPIDLWENFKVRNVTRLRPRPEATQPDGAALFSSFIPLLQTGLYGYFVRVTPEHPNLAYSHGFHLVHRS